MSAMLLQENTVVADRFRLVRMIGRGGMGSVWQAEQTGLGRICALKFIEGELANVAEAHARFEREAKAAAQLKSPHVVEIYDHGVWQGIPYIAMELLDGVDLGRRLVERQGKLAASETNTIITQVCRALHKAHAAGVVHRDLKPDNIFLVRDDDREIVKILDFGVAKQTSQAIDGSNTKTGAMLGTPYYMSPEQAQGIKSVDSRSDLWSLAVIVFQCLTGRLPFESEALGDLLVKIIVSPIPTPSSYGQVPPAFDAWWQKAADRNPDNRFQTAKIFGDSLTEALVLPVGALTEMMDRSPMHRPGGSTAFMPQGGMMSTPHPLAQTPNPAATGAPAATGMMSTPNPAMHTPPGALMQTPNPGLSPSQGGAATFDGVATGMPKKSVPVGLIVGLAALAVVGLAVGGFALTRKSAATGGDHNGVASSASIASTTPATTESAGPHATQAAVETHPAPSASVAAANDPEGAKSAAVPSAAPSTTTAAVSPAGGAHRPSAGGGGATAKPSAKPVASAAATPTAKPSAKPLNLGF